METCQGGPSMPRVAWGLVVFLAVTWAMAPVAAQPVPQVPVGGSPSANTNLPPEPVTSSNLPPEPSKVPTSGIDLPVLGAPVRPADPVPQNTGTIQPVRGDRTDPQVPSQTDLLISPVPHYSNAQGSRAAVLGVPTSMEGAIPAGAIDPPISSPSSEPLDYLQQRPIQLDQPPPTSQPFESSSGKLADDFGNRLNEALGQRNEWFKSDHAFDGFISPVTNPFLFEDPRSLTEVRPIFLIEKIPSAEPDFHGGNTFFFGTQLRLAITDRLSFTINKFGFESFNPGPDSEFRGETGFAEFWLGAKYTFIRDENTGTLLAGGLQFQIPTGASGNFQDTGTLSIVPYVSYAQSFLRDLPIGSFNAMVGGGYSFSVNNERSDYFYLSAHVDMNVLNQNKFFPLMEMNWFTYTTNGKSLPIGVEGQDLINFGGEARGQGLLTWAIGARYKFSECYQLGGAFEVPIAGPHDINEYRFTLDFIVRY
jgi:hypothetical protein